MYNKAPDLKPIVRLPLLENVNAQFYECARSNNRNTEERKRAHAEETAGWRFQNNLRIRGEHLNSPYMKRI